MSTADLLAQGIAAARNGRKAEAQATFLKVLEADDRSEQAWLWLSGVMESPDEQRICLENVLTINPANPHARRGMQLLGPGQPTPRPPTPPAHTAPPTQTFQPGATLRLPDANGNLPDDTPRPAAPPTQTFQPGATLRLPDANGNLPDSVVTPVAAPDAQPAAAAGPSTGATVELQLPPEVVQAPKKQPWWALRKTSAAEAPQSPPQADQRPAVPSPPDTAPASSPAITPANLSLALPAVAIEDSNAEEPCPYCGATTLVGHSSCPACHKSLMARSEPREQRSVALIILVVIYGLNSVGALAGGVLLIMMIVGMASTMAAMGMDFPILPVVGIIAAVLVAVGLLIAVTLGLFRRRPWAYITHCINVGLSVLSTIGMIAMSTAAGAAMLSALGELDPEGTGEAAGAVGAAAGSIGMAVICNVVMLVGFLALTVLSYGDFFGRKVRMSTAGLSNAGDPYNAGVSYRKRGMWYMAAHQWELAAMASPRDLTVRRALGLAYAQLKRYDQARDALSVGLAIAPGDHQLTEDLALVERLATKR